MISPISLEDLVIILTVICCACVIISAAIFVYTLHILSRFTKRMEIERHPYVIRDSNGEPIRKRVK